MVEIVIQKVDPREGPVRQLIEELDAYQNMLYPAESNYQLDFETMAQPEMRFYSVAVDGVSLTVAALAATRFGIQIVPHTWTHTALSAAHVGDAVNLEADVIGKYVARLMDAHRGDAAHFGSVAAIGGGPA